MFIVFMLVTKKFKPMYEVTLDGQEIGIVSNKAKVESEIQEYIEKPQAPVVEIKVNSKPEYELKFASLTDTKLKEEEILEKIDEKADKTYKVYNIKMGEEVLAKVTDSNQANKIIEDIKKDREFDKLAVEEEITKRLEVTEVEEARKLAFNKVSEVQEQQRKEAEAKRDKLMLSSRSLGSRGGSSRMGTSVSPQAYESLKGMRFINPTGRPITCGYMGYRGHTGVDMQGTGMPVKAANSGVVTAVIYKKYSYGHHVIVDHGNGVSTLYAHLSTINVSVGQRVSTGQQIAVSGATGNVTGPHLHFEIRINGKPINPTPYI